MTNTDTRDLAWLRSNLAKRLNTPATDLRIAVEDARNTLDAIIAGEPDLDRRTVADLAWLRDNLAKRLAHPATDLRLAVEDAHNTLDALLDR